MEIQYVIPGVLLFAFFAYAAFCFGRAFWSLFDHTKIEPNAVLKPDAKIVGIDTNKVTYLKNGTKYKTTVRFSDGFSYITHATDRDDKLFTYTISISPELRKAIIAAAIESHEEALKKQK